MTTEAEQLGEFYPVFADWSKRFGAVAASQKFALLGASAVEELSLRYEADVAKITAGGPAIIAAGIPPWYSGPSEGSIYWPPVRNDFEREKWPKSRIEGVNKASNVVVAHTPQPSQPQFDSRGLVVGYVQSGKTTNFISVIAKMADEGYRLVVVLSGVHNGLRKQTQLRLKEKLEDRLPDKWLMLTDESRDFHPPTGGPLAILSQEKTAVAVVKKNAAVLKRLVDWLNTKPAQQALRDSAVLVIDDEADQASVATKSINPLVRSLLRIGSKVTYIGYTATPFANVFIDPMSDDLYPRDFILNLPRPEGYFGPERIFGRDAVEGEDVDEGVDGYDMIRVVPDEDVDLLRPSAAAAVGFVPTLTRDLQDALLWFWLATSVRRLRGDVGHSTMLVHTSLKIDVQESYRQPIEEFAAFVMSGIEVCDSGVLSEIRRVWDRESVAVPPAPGHAVASYDDVLLILGAVVGANRVILDNYRSAERLVYGDDAIVAIAVGGNTLSRGLTLEGLVVSFFIRSANAYDTLLQMGRWFGYRHGYEDLPRIWMTETLRLAFRHLAAVEAEMRSDIDGYQEMGLTPTDVAVRIKTHPSLRITAKMGAAQPHFVSYAGRRLQTRFFDVSNEAVLHKNFSAADVLLSRVLEFGTIGSKSNHMVVTDVPVRLVLNFLESYVVHPDSPDLDTSLMAEYIRQEMASTTRALSTWAVALVEGTGEKVAIGGRAVSAVVRSRLRDGRSDRADIKTLMSKPDRALDLDLTASEAQTLSEPQLMMRRNDDAVARDRGLLVLYILDRTSTPLNGKDREPLGANQPVVAVGLVFPGEAAAKTRIQAPYMKVDLSQLEPAEHEAYENDTEDEAGAA
jgi:hypothetical protein